MTFTDSELTEIVNSATFTKTERSLAAALLEATRDARRYRYVRDPRLCHRMLAVAGRDRCYFGAALDAAIDAAIAEGKAK